MTEHKSSTEKDNMTQPSDWVTRPLSELIATIGGGTPKTDNDDYWKGSVRWLTPSEISDEKRLHVSDTERKITREGLSNSSAKVLPPGSVLMTSRATVGVPVINDVPMATNQGFIGIKPGDEINNEFLLHWIRHKEDLILSRASGSTYPEISQTSFNNLEIDLPPLPEQRKIGRILSVLDEKYELNIDIIKTLEETIQTIYNSWFVSYGIYDKFKKSEEGRIPTDFEIVKLDDICGTSGGGTPDTDISKYWGGKHFWLTPKEVTSLDASIAYNTERTLTEEGLDNTSAKLMPPESVLLTSRATVGEVVVNKQPMATNQGFICIMPGDTIPPYFLMQLIKDKRPEIESRASGSTYDEISQTSFNGIKIALPPESDRDRFEEIVAPMYDQIHYRQLENDSLREIRETLLPRLVSGQLRLDDVDLERITETIEG